MINTIYHKLCGMLLIVPLAACVHKESYGHKYDLPSFLEMCKEELVGDPLPCRCGDPFQGGGNDDWLTLVSWEEKKEFRIVYADANYMSFRAVTSVNETPCAAHGTTHVEVGVLDRKAGRRLTVSDFIPVNERGKVLAQLRQEVVTKIGGEDELQGEVTLTENFYVAKDGLHFVFNEYEVACYGCGIIDVVVKQ